MNMAVTIKNILQAIKQTKMKILVIVAIAIVVIVAAILLLGKAAIKYSLSEAVFYYKGETKDTKLFYIMPGKHAEYLLTIPSEESADGKYKVPQNDYFSHDGKSLIYFKKIGEVPVSSIETQEGYTAYRKIYKPQLVDLKKHSVKEINQEIDSGGVVFSPDDTKIAWVMAVKESTFDELEQSKRKREAWTSNPDGTNAKLLAILDDKVVLPKEWNGDYVYFVGSRGIGYYSLGEINIRTGRVKYFQPKYCLEDLTNCKDFKFYSSGELFIYQANIKDGKSEKIALFVESPDKEKSWQILVKNYISDKLFSSDGKSVIYTEQINANSSSFREKIHLVNLETNQDQEIYSGSYISQIIPDKYDDYLYFIEKETDTKFNLVRLNIQNKKAEIIDSGRYDDLKIFSAN